MARGRLDRAIDMEVNFPSVVAEVGAQFEAYERALVENDVEALDGFFWSSEEAVRFGIEENLYGARAIASYRRSQQPGEWVRTLFNTFIVAFGNDAASVCTEFSRHDGVAGRQSQMWIRLPEGWRIVAAHVSVMPDR